MLSFRFACSRHQRMFIDIAKGAGCHNPSKMDEIGRKILALLSIKYPKAVLDHFNEESCLGCKFEKNRVELDEIEAAIVELAKSLPQLDQTLC